MQSNTPSTSKSDSRLKRTGIKADDVIHYLNLIYITKIYINDTEENIKNISFTL